MPSAKNASCLSSLMFSNGSTAMLFSETAGESDTRVLETDGVAWMRGFDFVRYQLTVAIRQVAARAAIIGIGLNNRLRGACMVEVCGTEPCNRLATSDADCGRFAGSFARHAAIVSCQMGETDAGSMSSSLRRSLIDGTSR